MRVSREVARRLGAKIPKKARVPQSKSVLVETLKLHLRAAGLPAPAEEVRVVPDRGWRFDLAYPNGMIAIECDGGAHSRGRHTRGAGFEEDCRKLNRAALAGWTVLRFTMAMIQDGTAIEQIASTAVGPGRFTLLPLSGDTASKLPQEVQKVIPEQPASGGALRSHGPRSPGG